MYLKLTTFATPRYLHNKSFNQKHRGGHLLSLYLDHQLHLLSAFAATMLTVNKDYHLLSRPKVPRRRQRHLRQAEIRETVKRITYVMMSICGSEL